MPLSTPAATSRSLPATQIWIVTADAAQARIFQAQHQDGEMTEMSALLNSDARLTNQQSVSDRAGRMGGASSAGSHAFEPRQSHAEHVAVVFAKRVCEYLSAACRNGEVHRIYLMADPKFLGQLREHFDPQLKAVIAQELAIDVAHQKPAQIRKALPERL